MPEEAVLDAPVSAPAEPAAAPAAAPIETPAAPVEDAALPAELEAVEKFVDEPEQPVADAVKDAEPKPESAKEPEKPAIPPVEDFSWDPTPGVKLLNRALDRSPAFKAELDKNPALKNLVYANASARDTAIAYQEHFLSPEQAKVAAERSARFAGYEAAFEAGGAELASVLFNTNKDKFFSMAEVLAADRAKNIRNIATAQQRQDWLDALDTIDEAIKEIRGVTDPTDLEQLPADVKAKLEQAKATQLQVDKAQAEANQARQEKVVSTCRDAVRQRHAPYLRQISGSLPQATQDAIFAKAYEEFGKVAMKNSQFRISHDDLYRTTKGDDTVKEISTLTVNASAPMRAILSRLVREEAAKFVTDNKSKHQVLTQRTQARTEPKGAAAAAVPVQQETTAQTITRAENLKAELFSKGLVTSKRLTSEEHAMAIDGSLFRRYVELLKPR